MNKEMYNGALIYCNSDFLAKKNIAHKIIDDLILFKNNIKDFTLTMHEKFAEL